MHNAAILKGALQENVQRCLYNVLPRAGIRNVKICPAPSTWMDGVYRVVCWVMRGFDAADR